MASGKKKTPARSSVVQQRSIPWVLIAGVTALLVVGGVVFGYAFVQWSGKQEIATFSPSSENPDPSKDIPGVKTAKYEAQVHVQPTQRVAYDQAPPFGGPHDNVWADCTGVVYPEAVRSENMVHSLEHGAVWITYNPDKVDKAGIDKLSERVEGKPYTMMSPYPGLDKPISAQSWGHQLKVDDAEDKRIDQFIAALRQNPNNVYPEINGSCQGVPGAFDTNNPPKFDPSPPPPNAVTMDGKGANRGGGNMGGGGMGGGQ